MNKTELVGRMTRDPEMKTSGANNTPLVRFGVAVPRRFKNADGNYDADFINCVAFGKTAEFIAQYFKKGQVIGVVGSIATNNYTNKDGQKIYTTEVNVSEAEFVGSKSENASPQSAPAQTKSEKPKTETKPKKEKSDPVEDEDDFMTVPDEMDIDLPFS